MTLQFVHYCIVISSVNPLLLQRLIDTLGKDDAEVRRRLSEMTRRITVFRVNEKALTRRFRIMEEVDGQQKKVIS